MLTLGLFSADHAPEGAGWPVSPCNVTSSMDHRKRALKHTSKRILQDRALYDASFLCGQRARRVSAAVGHVESTVRCMQSNIGEGVHETKGFEHRKS